MLYFCIGLVVGIIIGGIFVEPLARYMQKRAKELTDKRNREV